MFDPSRSRFRVVSGLAFVLAATAAIACSAPPPATPAATPAAGAAATTAPKTAPSPTAAPKAEQLADALVISTANMSPQWDPLWPLSNGGMQASRLALEALTTMDDAGTIQPMLATSWSQLNPTTVQFRLRPNVRFHNNEAFDSQAVVASVNRMLTLGRPAGLHPELPLRGHHRRPGRRPPDR